MAVGIFFIALALVLTFSRSGWITAIGATFFLTICGTFVKEYRRRTLGLLIILITTLGLLIVIMGWAIFPRARLAIDNSINDRIIYNNMSLEIMKSRPLGVGIGNEMLYGINNGVFDKFGMTISSRWQPIHNLYLLIGTELGVLGILVFFLFLGRILVSGFKTIIFNNENLERKLPALIAITMLGAMLVSGLFDHFLWDLQSGRLMLWLVLGIIMGLSPRRSTDRTRASGA